MILSCLIVFAQPVVLKLFLEVCIEFAGMDVLNAEDTFEANLKFVDTPSLNNAFDFYGIEGMIMLLHSGSYFVM